MSDWSAGYISDIEYTYGYYRELNPLNLYTSMLKANLSAPKIKTACELGFGQGLTTAFHAAASDVEWYGTDFNPSQASFAQEMVEAAGANAELSDESFEEFCLRPDLPDFDFIALHGIWSWITDDNRKTIIEFVRRKLKVGGVLYISYNTLPGWASFAPMRHLMSQHAEIIGSEGKGILSRVDGALKFAEEFLATNPTFAQANPIINDRLKSIKQQNKHYLAHEYFNSVWDPMHFLTLAKWIAPARLDFGCSALILDQFDSINMTEEQTRFLGEIPDVMLRESTKDFMINQQFRRDYWVKGPRHLSPLQAYEKLQSQSFVLVVPRDDVSLKVTGSRGEMTMNEDVYVPILDALANHEPAYVVDLAKKLESKKLNHSQILEAILILTSSGQVSPAHDLEAASAQKEKTDSLNDYLIQHARSFGDINYLATPVTGGGIVSGRFEQLFTGLVKAGLTSSTEIAQSVWNTLSVQNQKLVKEGKTIESAEDNLAELEKQAKDFIEKRLPILKALMVV